MADLAMGGSAGAATVVGPGPFARKISIGAMPAKPKSFGVRVGAVA